MYMSLGLHICNAACWVHLVQIAELYQVVHVVLGKLYLDISANYET